VQGENGEGQTSGSGFPEYGEYGAQGSGTETAGTEGEGIGGGSSTGTADTGTAGAGGADGSGTEQGAGGIAYGTGDDPFGDLRNGSGSGAAGAGSTQARIGELDSRLEEGYAVFDGMILGERDRAQGVETPETATSGGAGGGSGEGSGSSEQGEAVILARNSGGSGGGGFIPAGTTARAGTFGAGNRETFEVPEDIPSGNNDDVVARQLREAAMTEPDPELREKLWDEYRAYTGLSN
jgi:hypothetical protein